MTVHSGATVSDWRTSVRKPFSYVNDIGGYSVYQAHWKQFAVEASLARYGDKLTDRYGDKLTDRYGDKLTDRYGDKLTDTDVSSLLALDTTESHVAESSSERISKVMNKTRVHVYLTLSVK